MYLHGHNRIRCVDEIDFRCALSVAMIEARDAPDSAARPALAFVGDESGQGLSKREKREKKERDREKRETERGRQGKRQTER